MRRLATASRARGPCEGGRRSWGRLRQGVRALNGPSAAAAGAACGGRACGQVVPQADAELTVAQAL